MATLLSLRARSPPDESVPDRRARRRRRPALPRRCSTRFPRATLRRARRFGVDARGGDGAPAPFGDRARVAPFELATLDWWDRMFGADLVVSSLSLHHLNDAKKQYLYKAIADRMSARGALLVADLIEPAHPSAPRSAAGRAGTRAPARRPTALGAPELFDRLRRRAVESRPVIRTRPIIRPRCSTTSSGCGTPVFRRSTAGGCSRGTPCSAVTRAASGAASASATTAVDVARRALEP